jgi:hypothetical protein
MLQTARQIAHIASVMFDGELCREIVTERSWKWMRDFDPDDRWSPSDNYDVEHGPFVAAKKVLLRLERLAPAGVKLGCNLWRDVPTLPGRVACLVQNAGPARWQKFGTLHVEALPEMVAVLTGGKLTDVPGDKSGIVTVLAPVRDSQKEVAGFVEVSIAAAPPALPW